MMNYALGDVIAVTIDNSHVIHTLAPCSKHRVDQLQVLKGTVVDQPKWLKGVHVCILNSDNQVLNYIPQHRIVSVNDTLVTPKPKIEDIVLHVPSSKTGEKYVVRLNGVTAQWSCTCAGHQFRGRCKHVTRAAEQSKKIVVDS
jgi:hypothetical protein